MTNLGTKSVSSNIPKLRFPGFSGLLSQKRLGDICEYKNGGSYEDRVIADGKYSLITLNSIDIDGRIKNKHKKVDSADWYLNKDDLIMVLSDVAHGYFLGLVDIIPVNNKYVLNQRMGLLRKTDDKVNLQFLRIYINKNQPYFKLHGQGSSQQNLSKGDIQKFVVNMPPLPEQQKIADFLSSVDSLLENMRSQKSSLESYKKSIMQKIFSKEIRFKDDSGKDYPAWKKEGLEDIGTVIGGGTPDTTKQEYWNGDINWFTPSEIKEKYSTKSMRKITEFGLKQSSARILPIGTLLFTSRATIGEISISREVSTTNQGFQSIIVNKNNSNEYFYYWMKFNKNRFLRLANGSTFLEISSKEMKTVKDSFPSLSEQSKIADFLISIDKSIESKQSQITKGELWKKGLMQQMFV